MGIDVKILCNPAVTVSATLGCARTLLAISTGVLVLGGTLTYLAVSASQHPAPPVAATEDVLTFGALGTASLLYLLFGFLTHLRAKVLDINSSAGDIMNGVFSTTPFTTDGDELAHVQNNLAHIAKEFDRLLNRVAESTAEAHTAADAEVRVSQRSAASSSEQAVAVAGIASAIEQMAASISEVSQQIKGTEEAALQARTQAEQGAVVVHDTINSIQAISQSVDQAVALIDSLNKRSEAIGQIIDVIEGIAAQTNLLALNAAIEAARAGEHGRGFAVVSDEVRQLAIRTREATDQVGDLIRGIQGEVQDITSGIAEVNGEVRKGVEKSESIRRSLTSIQAGAVKTVDIMHAVATAILQQTAVCEDIAESTERVSRMAATNNQDAIETKDTAIYLETLSERVQTLLPNRQRPSKGRAS